MTPTLRSHARSYVGLDASRSMLGSTPADELFADRPRPTWIQGSAFELPFTDRAFDLVVCNRLLHHLEEAALPRVLGELLRVSSDLVLVSFWDATTYQGWRRSRGLRRATSDLRIPRPRSRMATAIHAAGGEVLGWRSAGLRLVTLQTFAAMRRR